MPSLRDLFPSWLRVPTAKAVGYFRDAPPGLSAVTERGVVMVRNVGYRFLIERLGKTQFCSEILN